MALGQAAVPDSFKSVLARAVLNKISSSTAGQGIQKQQCTHLEAFVPKRPWDELQGNTPSAQQMKLSEICRRLGNTVMPWREDDHNKKFFVCSISVRKHEQQQVHSIP